jgi:hypothetical protein
VPDTGAIARSRRRALSCPLTICWTAFTLIFLTQATAYDSVAARLIAGTLAVASAIVTVRAHRMATIIVEPDEVTVRAFYRTTRLRKETIARFFPEPRRDGFGRPGYTLAVELTDRQMKRFGEFFSRESASAPSQTERIAVQLNNWRQTLP